MRILRKSSIAVLAILVMGSATLSFSAEKTCIDCHKKVIAKREIHPAIGQFARIEQGCSSCHMEPHAQKKGALSLAAAVPDLCYMCHDKATFAKEHVHPPVAGGDCLTCHDPHASDTSPLLTQPSPYLCQNCHPDKTDGKHILHAFGFGDDHPIQGRVDPSRKGRELSCVSCHNPHSSGKKNLLVNDAASSPIVICFVCHTKITVRP